MMHIKQTAALMITGLAVSGCSLVGSTLRQPQVPSTDYVAISSNLVDAIAQYPQYNRMMASLEKSAAGTAFEQQVYVELEERGYDLAEQDSDTTGNAVDAAVRNAPYESGENASLYVLSIGDISVERRFRQENGATVPVSELVVRGGERRNITLNDALVFSQTDPEISDVRFLSQSAGPADQNAQLLSAAMPATEDQQRALAERESMPAVHQNIYETLESNYTEALTEYEDIEQKVLVFPNDSLIMGDTNKQVIEHYVEMMDPQTDVLSVIGCSHGDTDISNGNAVLALGRAHRVKEAFLFSGIQPDQVLDEGCWAPEHFNEMPARGVVLTLKRRKDA